MERELMQMPNRNKILTVVNAITRGVSGENMVDYAGGVLGKHC